MLNRKLWYRNVFRKANSQICNCIIHYTVTCALKIWKFNQNNCLQQKCVFERRSARHCKSEKQMKNI